MRKLTLEEIKQTQLSVLRTVDKFCRSNNIKYTLAAGTLIGAVRHNGYIPWDDDIDIYMLREDYERFLAVFTVENYRVYTYKNDSDYNFPFAKVADERTILNEYKSDVKRNLGINIDVFPVDNMPNDKEEAKALMRKIYFYKKIVGYKRSVISKNRGILRNCALAVYKLLLLPFSFNFFNNIIERQALKFQDVKTDFVGNMVYGYGLKERCPNIGYDNHIEMSFEGYPFKVISSYRTYLTNVYGDYMTPPPIDKQVAHHYFEAFEK